MTKREIINDILERFDGQATDFEILRVYGVSCGVGYDYTVRVSFDMGGYSAELKCHAMHSGWAYPGHSRLNNPPYKYTGSNDKYQEKLAHGWETNPSYMLEEYLKHLKKSELEEF